MCTSHKGCGVTSASEELDQLSPLWGYNTFLARLFRRFGVADEVERPLQAMRYGNAVVTSH